MNGYIPYLIFPVSTPPAVVTASSATADMDKEHALVLGANAAEGQNVVKALLAVRRLSSRKDRRLLILVFFAFRLDG